MYGSNVWIPIFRTRACKRSGAERNGAQRSGGLLSRPLRRSGTETGATASLAARSPHRESFPALTEWLITRRQ